MKALAALVATVGCIVVCLSWTTPWSSPSSVGRAWARQLFILTEENNAGSAKSAEFETASARQDREGHIVIAVCFFGFLPTNKGPANLHGSDEQEIQKAQRALVDVSFPSFHDRVIVPNQRGAVHSSGIFDIFSHTWSNDSSTEKLIHRLYRPKKALFGMSDQPRTGMFASIQLVTQLKRLAETEQGWRYDFVLYARFDFVWTSEFIFARLSPSLFYVANWCTMAEDAQLYEIADPNNNTSRACFSFGTIIQPDDCQVYGVPDYYFAANSSIADKVFSDMQDAFLANKFISHVAFGRCCCNHAIMRGRLHSLGLWRNETMGRYLLHHVDINITRSDAQDHLLHDTYACYREHSFEQFVDRNGTVAQHPSTCDTKTPTATSCCTARGVLHCMCGANQWKASSFRNEPPIKNWKIHTKRT